MKLTDGLTMCEVAGNTFIMMKGNAPDQADKIIKISDTGRLILNFVEQGLSAQEIAERFVDQYGIAEKTALQDVLDFLAQMKECGIAE